MTQGRKIFHILGFIFVTAALGLAAVTEGALGTGPTPQDAPLTLPIRGTIQPSWTGIRSFEFQSDGGDQVLHFALLSPGQSPVRIEVNGSSVGVLSPQTPLTGEVRLWIPKERQQKGNNLLRFQGEAADPWKIEDLYVSEASAEEAPQYDPRALVRAARNLADRYPDADWAKERVHDYASRAMLSSDRDDALTESLVSLLNGQADTDLPPNETRSPTSIEPKRPVPSHSRRRVLEFRGPARKTKKMVQTTGPELELKRLYLEGYAMELTHPTKALERYLLVIHRAPPGNVYGEKARKRMERLIR